MERRPRATETPTRPPGRSRSWWTSLPCQHCGPLAVPDRRARGGGEEARLKYRDPTCAARSPPDHAAGAPRSTGWPAPAARAGLHRGGTPAPPVPPPRARDFVVPARRPGVRYALPLQLFSSCCRSVGSRDFQIARSPPGRGLPRGPPARVHPAGRSRPPSWRRTTSSRWASRS
ncbi:hypothetical protein QJS66_04155 [Kocuria rhizophila]|nr:hypothetical protein QJS66_04155 [Kocuria rhizophila]